MSRVLTIIKSRRNATAELAAMQAVFTKLSCYHKNSDSSVDLIKLTPSGIQHLAQYAISIGHTANSMTPQIAGSVYRDVFNGSKS